MGGRTIEENLEYVDDEVNKLLVVIQNSSLSEDDKAKLLVELHMIDREAHMEKEMIKMEGRTLTLYLEHYDDCLKNLRHQIELKVGV